MIYSILVIFFVLLVWLVDLIYFSQSHSKIQKQNYENLKKLKDSYSAK